MRRVLTAISLSAVLLPLTGEIAAADSTNKLNGVTTSAAKTSRKPPNVVTLLVDDLGYRDIGCYGGPVKTPVLDRLAAAGVRFTDFHSGAPVCSPSRATFLTGRNHHRTGVYSVLDERFHRMHLLESERTIAEVLSENGYATAHFGKWHLGMPVQNRKNPTPADHGFYYWFGVVNGPGPSHKNPTNFLRNGERVGTTKGYSCQIVVDEALTWIDQKRDGDEPFFLNLWFNEPHDPIAAPDEIVSQYGGLDERQAVYSGTIDNTDRAIGRLVAKLEKIGELDNTIIIYASDNGSYLQERNGELRGKKGALFEGGHRVPGIFYWKGGIPGGRIENEPAGVVDLLPTLCGLIGIDKPKGVHLDGSDLSPLLTKSGEFTRHQPLFWMSEANMVMRVGDHTLFASSTAKSPIDFKTADRLMEQVKEVLGDDLERELGGMDLRSRMFNGKFANPEANRLRDQHRRLFYFQEAWIPEQKKSGFGRVQLYDLSKDLGQRNNIANQRPELAAQLKEKAAAIYRSVMAEAPEWPAPEELAAAKDPQEKPSARPAHGASDTTTLLARIDKNDLPKGYHGSRHQAYVDKVMAGLKPEQRRRVGQLWKEKRRRDPDMPNPGASFVRILTHVAAGALATTLDAADEERQSASTKVTATWMQSYEAGYVDTQGRYAGGSEILHLEGHKGKLYAANSYWMEPSNIWYGGKDPKTPWSQILRLDHPSGKWEVDLELGPNNLRAENLKSVTFGTDGAGNRLEKPVTLLVATAYSPNPRGADINIFVRDDDAGEWKKTVLLSGTGESGENNSTRCMTVYRDRVTGVDRLFLPIGLIGIFTGVYDPDVPGKIRWGKTRETGRLDKRSLAIIEANDSLVYSSGTKIYRRNDGPSPTHSMIFDARQLSKGPVASPVGGVRGLSVIPNPKGSGESLMFVWAPDSRSRSCVIRLDADDNGTYSHIEEECVADLMSEYLSGTPVYYALAGYNNILPVLNPDTKEQAYLMGFECWVGGRQFPCWQGNERGGFYAGAMYAIRDKNAKYWLNEVNGPTTVEKSPLQSVRTYEVSPFESEEGKVIYFGGFVADHGPSPNTAWVYKTSIENALRKDAPRPVRLTPEQSKAQLAALRQPYLFEYHEKPAFTIQIPGEFARGNASGGDVFHAKKAFNTLSIKISQSEDPEQAARRYVESLKRAGNGTAKMLRHNNVKLPNGTPAVEFVATWVTKQNAKQTTQALTACKDGHAVTIATHTWEVAPPDTHFFFTLDFEQ